MDMLHPVILTLLLGLGAYLLGGLPFALWIGRRVLKRDIREMHDHNPGATNVFRAGGRVSGFVAVFIEMAKGMPFVWLSYAVFGLPVTATFVIGLCAILGHAFTPFLGFHGGKATAVTGGVLLAIPQHDLFFIAIAIIFISFLALESEEWRIVFTFSGTLVYAIVMGRTLEECLFVFGILVILSIKNAAGLRSLPRRRRHLRLGLGI